MNSYFSISQTERKGDDLSIYDGPNAQSIQIKKLSGKLESFNISSTGNSLFVKFISDESLQYDGFFATIHYGKGVFTNSDTTFWINM